MQVEQNSKLTLKLVSIFQRLIEKYGISLLITGIKTFLVEFEDEKGDYPKGFLNICHILQNLNLAHTDILSITEPLGKYQGSKPCQLDFICEYVNVLLVNEQTQYLIQHVDLQQFKAKVDVYKFLENRRVESITCLLNLYKTLDTKSDQPFQFQSINLKDDVIKQTLIRMPLVCFKFFTNIITTSEIITLLKSGGLLILI